VGQECFDKVLKEQFKKNLMCKMKNVITRGSIGYQCHLGIGDFTHGQKNNWLQMGVQGQT